MDITVSYIVEACIHCNFQFAVPKSFNQLRKRDHKTFFCPSCKGDMYYPGESDLEKLKKETTRLKTRLNDEISCCISAHEKANHLEKRVYGYMGYTKKLKNQLMEIPQKENN